MDFLKIQWWQNQPKWITSGNSCRQTGAGELGAANIVCFLPGQLVYSRTLSSDEYKCGLRICWQFLNCYCGCCQQFSMHSRLSCSGLREHWWESCWQKNQIVFSCSFLGQYNSSENVRIINKVAKKVSFKCHSPWILWSFEIKWVISWNNYLHDFAGFLREISTFAFTC